MSAMERANARIDPTSFVVAIGACGEWIVRGPGDRCGGLFASLEAAMRFVRRERQATLAAAQSPLRPAAKAARPATGNAASRHDHD